MIKVRFELYCMQRKPGDRATHAVDCYLFKVMIGDFVAAEFDQYRFWMEHVGDYEDTYKKARKYADDLADVLKVPRPALVRMIEKTVKTSTWVEDGIVEGIGP